MEQRTLQAVSVLSGLLMVATIAPGQTSPKFTASAPLRVNPLEQEWYECSIGVSQVNHLEALVAAIRTTGGSVGTAAIFMLPGGPLISNGSLACGTIDPWVAAEPGTSGRIWVTALGTPGGVPSPSCDLGVYIGWKDPGQGAVPSSQLYLVPGLNHFHDRPSLAIGSPIGGGPDARFYITSMGVKPQYCSEDVNLATTSIDPTAMTPTWTVKEVKPAINNTCDWKGWGPVGVVLDSGRIVAALTDLAGQYNFDRPYIYYSDDQGVTWESADGNVPLRIDPLVTIEATTIDADDSSGCGGAQGGDTPEHADRRNGAPSIAVDRSQDPNHVYVAFYARSRATSSGGSTNTDLFIARSTDGGTTWPSLGSPDLVQITDQMLGLTDPFDTDHFTGVDQYVPAIAVDSCGGVSVMFYDNRADTDRSDKYSMMDVYFARITNFDTTPVVESARLTTESFPADHCTAPIMNTFLGDYHNMAVSADGAWIWAAYIARQSDATLGWSIKNCYAHRIQIHCLQQSDFNGDGEVTDEDATEFLSAWAEEEPEADVDLNWAVDGADITEFMSRYNDDSGSE